MNILSIQLGHNATVAYMEWGELKYVLQEEKFDNVKNSDRFPLKALRYLSQKHDLTKLDRIAIASLSIHRHLLSDSLEQWGKDKSKSRSVFFSVGWYDRCMFFATRYFSGVFDFLHDSRIVFQRKRNTPLLLDLLSKGLGFSVTEERVDFIEHHVCHALSPIYFYGLYQHASPSLILTLDGSGDKYCSTVRIWRDGALETLATTRFWHSLWYLWSSVTAGMWMKPLEHEYKIMGLAAYTERKYFLDLYEQAFKKIISIDGLSWRAKFPMNRAYMYLRKCFYANRFDSIAGALQHLTEETVSQWIENAIRATNIRRIATSGGVFMNVKLNKKIQEMSAVESVHFMPSCGDESNVIGAIFWSYLKSGWDLSLLSPINSMYSGVVYTEDEISHFVHSLDPKKYQTRVFSSDDESSSAVVELLEKFEIVGVMRGAGEWGARSLCNRAILANASDLKSFHTVNDMIKMRDFWMPFAPVILDTYAHKYIKDWDIIESRSGESHQYMISAVDSTSLAQEHLRAAIHQKDKTLRPQIVHWKNNPWIHSVLTKFSEKTEIWGLMNTSLNIHGYPLVWTLEQAMFTMDNSGMKYLLLWNHLIAKL